MFIRLKKLKGKEYGYLVRNKWTKKGPRQRVAKYLGRAYSFQPVEEMDFIRYVEGRDKKSLEEYIKERSSQQLIDDLVVWELLKHGFRSNKGTFTKDEISVRPRKKRGISHNKQNLVLVLNEGHLCNHTLRKLRNFNEQGTEEEVGKKLAQAFVDAGIKIPPEIFIEMFQKVY